MSQLSQYIVLLWLLPVLVQIILPLMLFVVYLPRLVMNNKSASIDAITWQHVKHR